MNRTRLTLAIDRNQDRLLARAEQSARAVDSLFESTWYDVVKYVNGCDADKITGLQRRLPSWNVLRDMFRKLKQVPAIVGRDLGNVARDVGLESRERLLSHLPMRAAQKIAKRRGLIERYVPDWFDDLIRPPSEMEIHSALFDAGWVSRIAKITSLIEPDMMAALIVTHAGSGKTSKEIFDAVLPLVENSRVIARRVTRDATLHVAHEIELKQWENLGPDVVSGYQIHAVRDARTRPEHLKRDGTVYHRVPKGDQKGFGDMPRPPYEADGKLAYNCRCFLSPVIDLED